MIHDVSYLDETKRTDLDEPFVELAFAVAIQALGDLLDRKAHPLTRYEALVWLDTPEAKTIFELVGVDEPLLEIRSLADFRSIFGANKQRGFSDGKARGK